MAPDRQETFFFPEEEIPGKKCVASVMEPYVG
jgi:hypothetical protein